MFTDNGNNQNSWFEQVEKKQRRSWNIKSVGLTPLLPSVTAAAIT
jgi:hypothetical protein